MDKAESSYEAMCFVTGLEEEEFISSDSMSKLRQVSGDLCFYQTPTVENHLLFVVSVCDSSLNKGESLPRFHEYPHLTSNNRFFNFFFFLLLQKNPSTVRIPEDDLGSESHEMDHVFVLDSGNVTDDKIFGSCKDAGKVLFKGTNPKLLLRG